MADKGLAVLEQHTLVDAALEGLPHDGGRGVLLEEQVHSVPDPPRLARAGHASQQRRAGCRNAVEETVIELTNQEAAATQLGVVREVRVRAEREELHVVADVLDYGVTQRAGELSQRCIGHDPCIGTAPPTTAVLVSARYSSIGRTKGQRQEPGACMGITK